MYGKPEIEKGEDQKGPLHLFNFCLKNILKQILY